MVAAGCRLRNSRPQTRRREVVVRRLELSPDEFLPWLLAGQFCSADSLARLGRRMLGPQFFCRRWSRTASVGNWLWCLLARETSSQQDGLIFGTNIQRKARARRVLEPNEDSALSAPSGRQPCGQRCGKQSPTFHWRKNRSASVMDA